MMGYRPRGQRQGLGQQHVFHSPTPTQGMRLCMSLALILRCNPALQWGMAISVSGGGQAAR